jgi:alkylhydroperoxidase family enzyme
MSRLDELFQRLRNHTLTLPGHTDPALRQAIEQRVAQASGRRRGAKEGAIPAALHSYLDKLTRNAYKITEDDLAALHQAGYSDDAIYELSIAAAVGAGAARLERGLEAVRGTA